MDDAPVARTGTGLEPRTSCPVCGCADARILLSLPYDADPVRSYLARFYGDRLDTSSLEGERYELASCVDCGLVFQRFVPAQTLLNDLYECAARADPDEVSASRGLAVRQAYSHDVEQLIRHFGATPAGVSVLDFGSGSGLWLQMAAAYGCRTAAAELSPSARSEAARQGHDIVSLDRLPATRFQFVNAEQVFEHLTDPLAVLVDLARAVVPGGLIRISVPNGSGIRRRLEVGDWSAPKSHRNSLNAVAPLEHLNCFDGSSLTRLGDEAGLRPFRYPMREHLHQMERARFIVSALVHRVRHPVGTMQLFEVGVGPCRRA